MTAIPLSDQIAAVRREIGLRERLYPRWVTDGKLGEQKAAAEIAAMKAVLESLLRLEGLET